MPASPARERPSNGSHTPVSVEEIVSHAVQALRRSLPGWERVTASDIAASVVSGLGGGQAHILTAAGAATNTAAVLHINDPYFAEDGDTVFFDRVRAAQTAFVEAGVSPRRLVDDPGGTWFIEEWGGRAVAHETISTELIEELARLVARTHSIDTAWYDDIRRRQRERHPALQSAPDASHIWFYVAMRQHFLDGISEEKLLNWISNGPVPASAAGSRLVTVHGDVHPGNLVRSERGLRLIDLEAAGVNYAIQDIAYCLGSTCHTDEHKEAFVRAYLIACGLPATTDDVFELRLDAERCRMATNHFDPNGVVQLPSSAEDAAGVGPLYPRLVATADRALENEELADDIVRNGFAACQPVVAMVRGHGIPIPGTPVGVLAEPAAPSWRTDLTINWDGTIQASWQRYRALVLGLVNGRVILTNCLDPARLRLRMTQGGIPVTGLRGPNAAPVALDLSGRHEGRSLVLSDRSEAWWNPLDSVRIGRREDAVSVHVEPDGVIRLADTPIQAFDCANGHTSPGSRVQVFHNFCGDHQRFSCHDDGTISPITNPDVVWGIDGDLVLVRRDDPQAEAITVDQEVQEAMRVEGPSTLVQDDPGTLRADGYVLELESHKGMAISTELDEADPTSQRLVLAPVSRANRFRIGADEIRPIGGRLLLGLGAS